ncbi:velvet factor-domain-containing protein [Lobosporangium transversale]|uniref:Velvet factor-domain-containing protein n=1 Tax=Lobosporangium transversale TaxID=64571 RepID=A0A1Y2GT54_9FUNG|nr:velvet factor-domain-containing protein [Lobosporangium transversale]ORZ22671.1 velvet factor-domain-containing protein [Lobosporangium transversale]|eukprot:XP_021883225.1 velvet factor-domain-containing protein [Lobosporangium transversale]
MVRSSSTPYCFVSGKTDKSKIASSSKYVLTIRQQPQYAKLCGSKERDRRPIDPPPIVQIKLADPSSDKNKDYLQSPYLFMCCNIIDADNVSGEIVAPAHRVLAGTVVSSLNRLKDVDNSDGGFFVFGDMSVRVEGRFRLRFTLFELIEGEVVHLMTTASNPFTVYPSKKFPGMSEPTFLSRCFSDQGVRIRIRKDHHVKPKKSSQNHDGMDGLVMHSPPSSCHEAEHSDVDADVHQPAKRSRSSTHTYDDSAYSSHGYPQMRHMTITARPKHSDIPYTSEPLDRFSPPSPQSFQIQDSSISRPRQDPYVSKAPEDGSRYYGYYSKTDRPSYHDTQSYYLHEYSHAGSYPCPYPYPYPHHSQSSCPSGYPQPQEHHLHIYAEQQHHLRQMPSSTSQDYHHLSHERGRYSEESPSNVHAPSHPMGAAHLSYSSSSSVNNNNRPLPLSVHAGRQELSAEPLNDQRTASNGHIHNDNHSHGYSNYNCGHAYHCRTPSMSSQHSDGNFSPPHPFSPPEPQMARGQSPPMSPTSALPSILPSLPRPHLHAYPGEKIQLPPIHTLSTHSPTLAPIRSNGGDQHYHIHS